MSLPDRGPAAPERAPDTNPLSLEELAAAAGAVPTQRRDGEQTAPTDPPSPGTPTSSAPDTAEIPMSEIQEAAGLAPAPDAAATEGADASAANASVATTPRRDQYIDGLRALALVRVVTYHTFGWVWLPVAFPSMGVMFALGGSLVAASLGRAGTRQARVLRKRVRRLLPPLWLFGAVLVAAMSVHGWSTTTSAGTPLTWRTAVYWLVPLVDPPGSAWGYDMVLPLWYIRTYLWLLLLSPFLLWLFRRYPLRTLAVPGVVLAAIGAGMLDPDTPTGDTIAHLATFGACWLLGFAHHQGRIARLPRRWTVLGALALMAAGLAFAVTHQDPSTGWDIDDIDPANAVYSAGAVLLLLRLYPRRTFLERTPFLSKLVSAMNARAMTIYLWGNVCILSATPVIESNAWTVRLEASGWRGQAAQYGVAWLLIGVVVLAVGWAEDAAAGRRPRLNPWPRNASRPKARTERPARDMRATRVPTVAMASIAVIVCGVLVSATVTSPPASAGGSSSAALPVAGAVTPGSADAPSLARYPLHEGVRASIFWVGAVALADAGVDGQSLSSAWDRHWAQHYGGCDGIGAAGTTCTSDIAARTAPDWFPTVTVPAENPYYVGLPYNDLDSPKSTDRNQIPWANDPGWPAHLHDRTVSFVKNRWVAVTGPTGTCYAQVEDSGPGTVDPAYVFGGARSTSAYGVNLSPAVVRCVGLSAEQGGGTVAWRFVDAPPPGPWATIITTRQVS